mmetsp:Transcript_18831/g.26551  ORF Transcript_18831/g.26551 Transcript_18831/m.26551 type:complete len:95 (+) Transcript_18831:143-427(+)
MAFSTGNLIVTIAVFVCLVVSSIDAGYASNKAPDLPKDFCPQETGDITATTGECMCHWQHKDGCVGSGCQFQYGLSWYHYSCEDCRCVAKPKKN